MTALNIEYRDVTRMALGFSAGVVADVPNESRLEPKGWGTATVE